MSTASKIKLIKGEPGWAINGRGTRVVLSNWIVERDGIRIGEVYQVLASCGKVWKISSPSYGSARNRADAVKKLIQHV